MAKKNLNRQLKGLFSRLADSVNSVGPAAPAAETDEVRPTTQLEGLFSDLEESYPDSPTAAANSKDSRSSVAGTNTGKSQISGK